MAVIDLGRYLVFDEIASGGMSSVHYGRMLGPAGFGRTVAIKRLHPHYAKDPDFVSMMLDEARVVSRIHHPNVVQTLDVVHTKTDLFLVMEYVPGATLTAIRSEVTAQNLAIPTPIVLALATNILLGLDAAHEATAEDGKPLGIIHRDVSPQNVLVGVDGSARLLDFGIARATGASHHSDGGQVKGKVAYMSPEQLALGELDRTTDVYAASVVVWEMLTGKRLFEGAQKEQIAFLVANGAVRSPRAIVETISEELEDIVMRGLEKSPALRFATAREMATRIEACGRVATAREVADWLGTVAAGPLAERAAMVAAIEKETVRQVDLRALATKIAEGGQASLPDTEIVPVVAPPRRRLRMPHVLAVALLLALVIGAIAVTRRPAPTPAVATTEVPPPVVTASSPPVPVASSAPAAAIEPAPSGSAARKPHVRAGRAPGTVHSAPAGNGLFDRN